MTISERCSHGKTWTEECSDCEEISLRETINHFEPIVLEAKNKLQEIEREKEKRNG